jgi:hypothetical protein
MAITTLDGVIAGLLPPVPLLKTGATMEGVGQWHSLWYTAGNPSSATASSAGLSGATFASTTTAGIVPFSNPVSGNTYLARFSATASVAGRLLLLDRLWDNSGIVVTTTTAQTINSVTWPARDRNASTNGDGVMVALEVQTATTNASANTTMTITYTNSAGTGSKTGTVGSAVPHAFPATAVAGTFVPFNLSAGDVGVRSIQSVTLAVSLGAGAVKLVAYREIASVDVTTANIGSAVDALTGGFPRLYDNSSLFLVFIPTATTATQVQGQIIYAQG